MTRTFTGLAWAGFLFWSVLCLGFWAVAALGGDLLRWIATSVLGASADGTAVAILHFIEAFGAALITWVWIAGTALIFFFGWFFRAALRNASSVRMTAVHSAGWEVHEMKDVTPRDGNDPDIRRLPER